MLCVLLCGELLFLGFERQGCLQQRSDFTGKAYRAPDFGFIQFFQVFEQMAEAFLLEPFCQFVVVIGQKAIGNQDALEFLAQNV